MPSYTWPRLMSRWHDFPPLLTRASATLSWARVEAIALIMLPELQPLVPGRAVIHCPQDGAMHANHISLSCSFGEGHTGQMFFCVAALHRPSGPTVSCVRNGSVRSNNPPCQGILKGNTEESVLRSALLWGPCLAAVGGGHNDSTSPHGPARFSTDKGDPVQVIVRCRNFSAYILYLASLAVKLV